MCMFVILQFSNKWNESHKIRMILIFEKQIKINLAKFYKDFKIKPISIQVVIHLRVTLHEV
jgi:hypothetical protein